MSEQTDVRELRERLEGDAKLWASHVKKLREFWGDHSDTHYDAEETAALLNEAAAALERLEALEAAMADPTYDQSGEACMWFRHDFGLMNRKDREDLRWQAREWIRAWRKTLVPAPADRTGGAE